MHVLVYHRRAAEYLRLIRERLPDLAVIVEDRADALAEKISDAEVLLGWEFPLEALHAARRLRWIQLTSAGVEHLLPAREQLRHVVVTNARGIHAALMADYTLGVMVLLQWNFRRLLREQEARQWRHRHTEPLAGKTLGVVGVGTVGAEIARRGASFGMIVVGLRRLPAPVEGVSRMFGPGQLLEMLSVCDFVALVVPATPETQRMVGERELRAMKRTAYLINIARGSVLDEPALVRALRGGWIAGAALDVFEREPLPIDNPLWTMDNVVITPHIAGEPTEYARRVVDIFAENVRRWRAGEPLQNVVDFTKGY